MALSRYKALAFKLAGIGISLILICLLYMYFSHDVSKLNSFYPQNHELQKERPKNWVTLKEISKYGIGAIVLAEDWGFYQHTGFDLNQIQVAFQEMLDGIRFRGASTISQQMVKNVYLTEDRTVWRKLHETILTHKVESELSKDRILEIYLNVIEFGPGIIGIKDASRHYFRKKPSALLPKEAAFLAMMLPSPIRYYVSFRKRKLTPFAVERIDAILVKMRMGKLITPAEYQDLKLTKLSWEK